MVSKKNSLKSCILGILGLVLLVHLVSSSAHAFGRRMPELETVKEVNVPQYMGLWYEIARIDQSFERGCTAVTAEYALQANGNVSVTNTCRQDWVYGEKKVAHGTAKVVDSTTNAKLDVSFFWPFSGDYWILELGQNYEYAVVGAPGRDYLWILARKPEINEVLYQEILQRRAAQGFPVESVIRTLQPSPENPDSDWGGV